MMSNKCCELHKIFNSMKRLRFPLEKTLIPSNGIYILFEEGEKGHDTDRIVRVGTHTGDGQLFSRLKQHFEINNKDRSIFRKNIGRAILTKENDQYIEKWELDLTTSENKKKFSPLIDIEYQNKIENKVSKIIQEKFSFIVFEVNEKSERLILESRIISEISNCDKCSPSNSWLGNYSPKLKIRKSGLWLVNELYKKGFDDDEFQLLLKYLDKDFTKTSVEE